MCACQLPETFRVSASVHLKHASLQGSASTKIILHHIVYGKQNGDLDPKTTLNEENMQSRNVEKYMGSTIVKS